MKENISTQDTPAQIKVICDACDCNATFKNEKEAYLAGWSFGTPIEGLVISFCPVCAAEKI